MMVMMVIGMTGINFFFFCGVLLLCGSGGGLGLGFLLHSRISAVATAVIFLQNE